MYKIVLFIPTMNRYQSVKEYIDTSIDICLAHNICIYIFDSSTNDETCQYINQIIDNKNCRDIILYKRVQDYPDKTTDLKVMEGFEEIKNIAEYVWLCGDGVIANIELCLKYVNSSIKDGSDVIYFEYEKKEDRDGIRKCNDNVEFFSQYGWGATSYGATIISTKLIDTELLKNLYKNYRNTGFLYWHFLFTQLSKNDSLNIQIVNTQYFHKNKYKKTNASYGNGKFLKFWVENWSNAVYGLPEIYESHKAEVAKDIGNNLHLYSPHNLIKLRGTNNLEKNQVYNYHDKFQLVTDVPFNVIALYTYFPKWLAKIYVKFRSFVAGYVRK
ncbi:MAG: hypothetical protein PHX08_04830 [Lachnospiraceae bacterium]|nr:hypothetical protein [Lachnospiraceae bacterium]